MPSTLCCKGNRVVGEMYERERTERTFLFWRPVCHCCPVLERGQPCEKTGGPKRAFDGSAQIPCAAHRYDPRDSQGHRRGPAAMATNVMWDGGSRRVVRGT